MAPIEVQSDEFVQFDIVMSVSENKLSNSGRCIDLVELVEQLMIKAKLQTMFLGCKCISHSISDSKILLKRLSINFKLFNLSDYDLK